MGKNSKNTTTTTRFVPLLFSTPMVEAILDNIKTETRRTQGLEKINLNPDFWVMKQLLNLFYFTNKFTEETIVIKAKIKVNDVIWVRETFQVTDFLHPSDENYGYIYKASENGKEWQNNSENWKWKPSLFMTKDACRIFLKCVSVDVERLQEINEEGAIKEGVENMLLKADTSATAYRNYMTTRKDLQKDHWAHVANDAVESYMTLWQKINGKDSWNQNPFVFVYKFERIERPDGFI